MADGKVVIGTQLDTAGAVSGISKLNKSITSTMKTGVKAVGVATVATAGLAVKTGADFDKAMSQVAATMGKSIDEIQDLRDFAQQMGRTTAFSATESAEALNYMALAGYDAQKSMKMLPTVLNLASAGNMDLALASDMVTDTQSALGLSIKETTELVDIMAKTASSSNTSVSQLGDAMLTIGGTAKSLKGKTTELAQVLGLLADNGIKGSEGGTALRNVILSLTAPTDKASELIEELGIKVFDAEGNMNSMQDIMSQFNSVLGSMTDKQRKNIIATIFNKRDIKSVEALLGTTTERWNELESEIDDAQGSAEKMAKTQLANLAGDFTMLKSAVEGALIEISDRLTPFIRGAVQLLTENVQELTEAFDKKGLAGVLDLVKNKFKTLLSTFIKSIPNVISQISTTLPKALETVAESMKDLFSGFSLSGKIGGISEIGSSIMQDIAEGIINSLPVVINTLGNLLISIMTKLNEILPQVYSMALEILPNMLGALLDTLPSIIEQIPPIFAQIAEQLVQTISDYVVYSFQLMQGYLEEVVQHLPDIINSLVDAIPDMIGSLLSAIISHAPDVALAGLDLLGSLFVNLPDILGALLKGVVDLVAGLVAMLYDQLPVIADAGIDFFMGLVERGPDILSGIGKFALDLVTNILDVLGALVSGLETIGLSMVKGLVGAFSTAWDDLSGTVSEWVSDVIDAIVGFFTDCWDSVTGIGTNIVEGIWEGISGAGDWLLDKISGFADDVVGGIAGFFGIASPSKVMRDEIGKYLAEGIWVGFEENDPMEQINKDLKYGMKGIENSMTVSGGYYAGINYEKLGDAVAQGFIDADVEWTVDNRQFARLERGYA